MCKLTEFMILVFSELFYSENSILNVNILLLRDNTSDFHYTELTPLGKVWQNKPLELISYSTVLYYDIFIVMILNYILQDANLILFQGAAESS